MTRFAVLLAVMPLIAAAQTTTTTRRPYVRAHGEATISVRPDEAKVNVAVVTEAPSAQGAADDNANKTSSVFTALRSVLGQQAQIETVSYSVQPRYVYPRDGGQPTLVGYMAQSVTEVTLNNLGIVGRVIDTAVQAGANRVDSLRFMLHDDEPVRLQALTEAGKKARARAQAIATGVGARLGAILSAEEGTVYRVPVVADARVGAGATAVATPVEPGQLEVRASITIEYELL
ncbi:MAG TPA: SIMPL domain-containing protein [Bryobacteraceae bacterium]|nr:SIMPL domain-containing protein [Bryobacteraceae bacterium]